MKSIVLTIFIAVSLISRISIIFADIVAFTVAWRKAIDTVQQASRSHLKVPLSEVLVRDGELPLLP